MDMNIDQLLRMLAPLFGRICIGGYFVWQGVTQILNLSATIDFFTRLGTPQPVVCAVVVSTIELVAGLALVVGWETRIVAMFLIVYTALVSAIFFNGSSTALFVANLSTIGGLLFVATYGDEPARTLRISKQAAICSKKARG